MSSERRYLWIAVLVVALGLLAIFAIPRLREELAPEPVSALVAVEVGDEGVGRVGLVELEAGQTFDLHAVLVATDRDGASVYYTEVEALIVDGERVEDERIRRWDRSGEIAVLWFTIEGFRPYMEVSEVGEVDAFRFEEAFRVDWGRGWSAPGTVAPSNPALARGFEGEGEVPFGTARYHVRIEKYFRLTDPAPLARYRSPGSADLETPGVEPTTVVVTESGLERVSAVFGMPQIEPAEGAASGVLRHLSDLYGRRLAFSRLLVFGGLLADHQLTWGGVEWTPVDLEQPPAWGDILPGDMLRSGERIVLLYEDRGAPGLLDYDDLCFDLDESAARRRLGEVFTGGGVLDWARLGPPSAVAEGSG